MGGRAARTPCAPRAVILPAVQSLRRSGSEMTWGVAPVYHFSCLWDWREAGSEGGVLGGGDGDFADVHEGLAWGGAEGFDPEAPCAGFGDGEGAGVDGFELFVGAGDADIAFGGGGAEGDAAGAVAFLAAALEDGDGEFAGFGDGDVPCEAGGGLEPAGDVADGGGVEGVLGVADDDGGGGGDDVGAGLDGGDALDVIGDGGLGWGGGVAGDGGDEGGGFRGGQGSGGEAEVGSGFW